MSNDRQGTYKVPFLFPVQRERFENTVYQGVLISQGVDGRTFKSGHLTDSEIKNATFKNCVFDGFEFRQSMMAARFIGCKFINGTRFYKNNSSLIFGGCRFENAAFSRNLLNQSRFEACTIVNSVFDSNECRDVKIDRSHIMDSLLKEGMFIRTNFPDTKLTNVMMHGVYFRQSSFFGSRWANVRVSPLSMFANVVGNGRDIQSLRVSATERTRHVTYFNDVLFMPDCHRYLITHSGSSLYIASTQDYDSPVLEKVRMRRLKQYVLENPASLKINMPI